ncbi:hypothetical protein [Aquimarina sp. RZ0]|uniref:hypothetical protein n=1 Tax=Aquimarina sp. RZ0 TaxID=2607730 RepID=UPI0011F2462C|nr:hypothetical protein [Aquimarina sp. RZ0]KAA1243379.1 hypothetical protein F0000_21210 [Aquimarina sp. RZ0]
MRIVFYCLGIILLFSSCNSEREIHEENTYEIVSLLVETTGKPMKPPPPPEGVRSRFTDSQINSILNRSQKVALYPVFNSSKKVFSENKKVSSEYNNLVTNLKNLDKEQLVDLSEVTTSESLKLSIIDTNKLKSEKRYIDKNYDILIQISAISFNAAYDKAALVLSASRGRLNGSSSIIYMYKVDGK